MNEPLEDNGGESGEKTYRKTHDKRKCADADVRLSPKEKSHE
jgi:hypothetical protein